MILKLPHAVCDYLCPINGVCDMYEGKTGERIPDAFLFHISAIGFSYVKQKNAPISKMVFWGNNGLGKRQYGFLQDIMGFTLDHSEGRSFKHALALAKGYLDCNFPVLLFGLDMFHLPYFEKFYHAIHVPGHIILMVGYSDQDQSVYIHDNSKADVQAVPYSDLKAAWNDGFPGVTKKNAMFAFSFGESISDVRQVLQRGIQKRSDAVLHPPVRFLGIPGMHDLASEFLRWEGELDDTAYKNALINMVTFTGSVLPMLPPRLAPVPSIIVDSHQACRDLFAQELIDYQDKYGVPTWSRAAALLKESGCLIGELNERITDRILGVGRLIKVVPDLIEQIAQIEEEAFTILLNS